MVNVLNTVVVVVVVDVDVDDVEVVVVVGAPDMFKYKDLSHTPVDLTNICVASSGTGVR
jgi:hypothetical protein